MAFADLAGMMEAAKGFRFPPSSPDPQDAPAAHAAKQLVTTRLNRKPTPQHDQRHCLLRLLQQNLGHSPKRLLRSLCKLRLALLSFDPAISVKAMRWTFASATYAPNFKQAPWQLRVGLKFYAASLPLPEIFFNRKSSATWPAV